MQVQARYASGVSLNYTLVAYGPGRGWRSSSTAPGAN